MPEPTAKKSNPKTPTTTRGNDPALVADDPTFAAGGAAQIVAELEQRFETLRRWHLQTTEAFATRRAELDDREAELKDTQAQADAALAEAEAQKDQNRQAREKLEHDRAAFETYCKGEEAALGKQKLACEEWVAAQHAAAESAIAQKQARAEDELTTLRAKADAALKAEYEKLNHAKTELAEARARFERERDELAQVRADLDAEWDSVRLIRAAEEATLTAWQTEHDRARQTQLRLVPADADTNDTAGTIKPAQAA